MAKQWARTSRSADSEETISILASVETVLCSAVWFWLVSLWGFKWAAWSLAITPLVLFRTESSTARGVRWMEASLARIDRFSERGVRRSNKLLILMLLTGAILLLPVRFFATVCEWFRDPVSLVRGMPVNWSRACFVRDSVSRLVALPGAESPDGGLLVAVAPATLWEVALEYVTTGADSDDPKRLTISFELLAVLAWSPVLVPVTVLALAYRYALKSTAAVYLPLIFIVKGSWQKDATDLLSGICTFAISRIQRIAAALIFAGFVAKLWIYAAGFDLMKWANGYLGKVYFDQRLAEGFAKLLRVYVIPGKLPVWQLASGTNALLTWGIYIYADKLLKLNKPNTSVTAIRWLKFISALLSLYTIAALVVITWREANFNLPPIGDWFPSTSTEPAG